MNNYFHNPNSRHYAHRLNNRYNYDPYSYPENLPRALQLIEEAAADEKKDEAFYSYLIDIAPYDEDKQVIIKIRDDERRNYELFKRIYYELTCRMLPEPQNAGFEEPETYCQGLKMAIYSEIETVKMYREILYAMCQRTHINIMTGIITDEQRHADYLNFLYSKNECYEEEIGEREEND